MKHIAVIGAGASGIFASLFAANKKIKVTIFEKQNKIGRKILSSGNGRCNISNKFIDISHYHGHNPDFVLKIFSQFGIQDTSNFFESLGIPLIEEENGRLFPASMQASSVIDIFDYELDRNEIDLKLNRKAEKIIPGKNKFKVITAGREEYLFDSVIISAGSCASPDLGASNAGYELAASLGHKIFTPFPAIIPINIPLKIIHTLAGTKWICRLRVEVNGKTISESTDELLFTKYGISGPAALNISRSVNQNIIEKNDPQIIIDFFPDLSEHLLYEKIKKLWMDPDKTALLGLSGIIKKRIPEVLLKTANVNPYKLLKEFSENEKTNLFALLKSFKIIPGNPRPFREAVIVAGGVDVDEIHPETMESKIIKNMFITGELLDIDGDSGGYNLQFAWSTGAIAGKAQ